MTASAYDCEIAGVYYNLYTKNNTASVTYLYQNSRNQSAYKGKVAIPSSITYGGKTYSVTSIDQYAFQYCDKLTSISIPPSITTIEGMAFYGCDGLTAVHVTDLEAWCNISFSYASGNPLFKAHHLYINGKEVKDLVIPDGVTYIGTEAFAGCSGLTSVTIPNSVEFIGDVAFEQCRNLSSITIPSSVTSIGWSPFADCNLTTIVVQDGNPEYDSRDNCNAVIETATNILIIGCNKTIIPEDITEIAKGAFYGCEELEFMHIPNHVEIIGEWAFALCPNLSLLILPSSVTCIGEYAFYGCNGLSDIYCHAEIVPETGSDVFYDVPQQYVILHVPSSSINDYKSASPWNDFGKIVALTDEDINMDMVNATTQRTIPISYYSLGGQRHMMPQKGVNIIKYNDGTKKKVLIK